MKLVTILKTLFGPATGTIVVLCSGAFMSAGMLIMAVALWPDNDKLFALFGGAFSAMVPLMNAFISL